MRMIFRFLREPIRQASKTAHVHAHRQVLPFDIAGRDVSRIRAALNIVGLRPDALRRAVTARIVPWLAVPA